MAEDSWFSPANLVSAWRAVAATFGAVVSWKVFAWQRSGQDLAVECEIASVDGQADWIAVHLTYRNGADTSWQALSAKIVTPHGAIGVSEWATPRGVGRVGYNGGGVDFEAARNTASNPFSLKASVDRRGTVSPQYLVGGDTIRETVYLYRPSLRSKKLSMRLSLVSSEAVQRKIVIAIKRQLNAAADTAIT